MGNSWRDDGYIIGKLQRMPELRHELDAGSTLSSLEFEQLYELSPDRARQLIGTAAALPSFNRATGRPTNVRAWFNKVVHDQLYKAQTI